MDDVIIGSLEREESEDNIMRKLTIEEVLDYINVADFNNPSTLSSTFAHLNILKEFGKERLYELVEGFDEGDSIELGKFIRTKLTDAEECFRIAKSSPYFTYDIIGDYTNITRKVRLEITKYTPDLIFCNITYDIIPNNTYTFNKPFLQDTRELVFYTTVSDLDLDEYDIVPHHTSQYSFKFAAKVSVAE
jgi:hypothetical protein